MDKLAGGSEALAIFKIAAHLQGVQQLKIKIYNYKINIYRSSIIYQIKVKYNINKILMLNLNPWKENKLMCNLKKYNNN